MKTKLLALLLLICCQSSFSQIINSKNPAIAQLYKKFNEAIKIAMNTEKLPWNSAIILADATVNHTLNDDFNAAERYVQTANPKHSMISIDSAIQSAVILNAFVSCPELANIKMPDFRMVVKATQAGRRTSNFPRIAMGMRGINTATSIDFASRLMHHHVSALNIFFDKVETFKAGEPTLSNLGATLSKAEAKFQSFPGKGGDAHKLICTFFDKSWEMAQFKLSFKANDYFGKIQKIEFVPKGNFQKDLDGPPPIDRLK